MEHEAVQLEIIQAIRTANGEIDKVLKNWKENPELDPRPKNENRNYYEIKGKLSGSDTEKTIHVEIGGSVQSKNDAMDYAAMFHNIDEIIHIRKGV